SPAPCCVKLRAPLKPPAFNMAFRPARSGNSPTSSTNWPAVAPAPPLADKLPCRFAVPFGALIERAPAAPLALPADRSILAPAAIVTAPEAAVIETRPPGPATCNESKLVDMPATLIAAAGPSAMLSDAPDPVAETCKIPEGSVTTVSIDTDVPDSDMAAPAPGAA